MRSSLRSVLVLATLFSAAVVPGEAAGFETHRLSVNGVDRADITTAAAVQAANRGRGEGNAPSGISAPAVSEDGSTIAFDSEATNLEQPGALTATGLLDDTNGFADVFVHDVRTGLNRRASLASDGGQANGPGRNPALSGNGRLVVFESDATNLVPGDTNGVTDIFVRDMVAGTTTLVTRAYDDGPANGPSRAPAMSGGLLVFESDASNLAQDLEFGPQLDPNGATDIFWAANITSDDPWIFLLSYGPDGEPANGPSTQPAIGAGGAAVAFASRATNLVAGDDNGMQDVFANNDVIGGTISLVSAGPNGSANGESRAPSVGGWNYPFVAFESDASDLISVDLNGATDVFMRPFPHGQTKLVSSDPDRLPPPGASWAPAASLDGIAFLSSAFDPRPGIFAPSVYFADLSSSRVETVSMGSMKPNGPSYAPSIGANGVVIAYASDASNLVSDDGNDVRDVFARVDESRCFNGAAEDGPASRPIHELEPDLGVAESPGHRVACSLAGYGL